MITVRAERDGREVAAFPLLHGRDPGAELAALGWAGRPIAVSGRAPDVTITYAAEPTPVRPAPPVAEAPGVAYQRLAVYAVVRTERGLLCTELSERTNMPGLWNLPGGGVDDGERPEEALVREVWEETGQRITGIEILTVQTSHYLGAAARGRENYHAVRLFHVASCPDPADPVVHDIGGTTRRARWVGLTGEDPEVGRIPLAESVIPPLRLVGLDLRPHPGPPSPPVIFPTKDGLCTRHSCRDP